MTQQEILAKLNIDKTDPEAVKGAAAAIQALMQGKGPAWPPPPPPPPTDPPLPKPPKPKDPDPDPDDERKGGHITAGPSEQRELSPEEMRRITYNRTLQAAKGALERAKAANADADRIAELEDAIAEMERLTEDVSGSIQDLSDIDFDTLINKTITAIKALGLTDDELEIDSEEEHAAKVQRLADVLNDDDILDTLEREDEDAIDAERAQELARQQNLERIKRAQSNSWRGGNSNKYPGFEDFLNSLYKAIALQVQMADTEEDSWTAINQRYYNSGVLKQGTKRNDVLSDKVPIIDFYFDVSGSWGDADIAMGKKAVKALSLLEAKKKIKLNVFYWSSRGVSTEYDAVKGGCTYAWGRILDTIKTTRASNVVIMTDGDMNGQAGDYGEVSVKGCVWYLWKNGITADKITKDLTGKHKTLQFTFTSKDAAEAYAEEQANNPDSSTN